LALSAGTFWGRKRLKSRKFVERKEAGFSDETVITKRFIEEGVAYPIELGVLAGPFPGYSVPNALHQFGKRLGIQARLPILPHNPQQYDVVET
jgi:hypothetical protein